MSITGERDDRPGGGPQKAGIPIADLITACTRASRSAPRSHIAPRPASASTSTSRCSTRSLPCLRTRGRTTSPPLTAGRLGTITPTSLPTRYPDRGRQPDPRPAATTICSASSATSPAATTCPTTRASARTASAWRTVSSSRGFCRTSSFANDEAMDRAARSGRRAVRTDQRSETGVRGTAGRSTRLRMELPHPTAGKSVARAQPDALFRDARRADAPPPTWAAHRRSSVFASWKNPRRSPDCAPRESS